MVDEIQYDQAQAVNLRRLILCIESDDMAATVHALRAAFPNLTYRRTALKACDGSHSDAVAFARDMLPDYGWNMSSHGEAAIWPPGDDGHRSEFCVCGNAGNPARALFIASLRAMLLKIEGLGPCSCGICSQP